MEIISVNKDEWIEFLKESPHATVFNDPDLIETYKCKVDYLLCKKGDKSYGGMSACSIDGNIKFMPFQTYGGIILSDNSDLNTVKRVERSFQVHELFAQYLFENYNEVCFFINHFSDLVDLRAYQWYNYHTPENGQYVISQCYSGMTTVDQFLDTNNYQRIRKRNLKHAQKIGVSTEVSTDYEFFRQIIIDTFDKNKCPLPQKERETIKDICETMVEKGKGLCTVSKFEDRPVSMSLFIYDDKRIYHLLGATDQEFKNTYAYTKNMYDSIKILKEKLGNKIVDLLGINSPQRGTFKLGFGAELSQFYIIEKKIPKKG